MKQTLHITVFFHLAINMIVVFLELVHVAPFTLSGQCRRLALGILALLMAPYWRLTLCRSIVTAGIQYRQGLAAHDERNVNAGMS